MPCADLSVDLMLMGKDQEAQKAMERGQCIQQEQSAEDCPPLR